jgi:beta-lactamase regulating signal transducer with metallopeptidase domain
MNSTLLILCHLAAKSTVLALFGFGVSILAHRASPERRAFVWTCVILAIGVLPAIEPVVPKIAVPILPRPAASPAATPLRESAVPANRLQISSVPTFRITHDYAVWAWSLGTLAVSGYFGLGYVSLRRWKRRARPAQLQADAASLVDDLRLRQTVSFLESAECRVPITWGWQRPVVLLPIGAEQWTAELRRQVLLHELAHIRRGDWLTQLFIQAICAAYWWNPLVWLCARQWQAACEEACDDLVLTRGVRPSEYAENLLAMTRALDRRSVAALAMARPSRLNRRICGILDTSAQRQPVSMLGKLTLAAISALACAAAAGLADTPAPAPPKPHLVIPAVPGTKQGAIELTGDHTQFENGIAIAEGNAEVSLDNVDQTGHVTHSVGHAKKMIYEASTGKITLLGKPDIQNEKFFVRSLDKITVIISDRDGNMMLHGPHILGVTDKPTKTETGAQPAK